MSDDIKEIDRPFHIMGILDGKIGGFHSGHATKELAEIQLIDVNKRTIDLGIKTRYIIKEIIKTQ